MTEEEWLAEQERSHWMLSGLLRQGKIRRTKAGKRKLRLFGCGCCRMVWHLLDEAVLRPAVEVAERFADGEGGLTELQASVRAVGWLAINGLESERAGAAGRSAAWMVAYACASNAAFGATSAVGSITGLDGEAIPCHLLRDVFGNPFRPAVMKREWVAANDRSVEAVARAIYQDRAFNRMPILADALEDAGCDDAVILAHCRGPGPHVRGCWVVDLILGKA
jgi:hypothetical protein